MHQHTARQGHVYIWAPVYNENWSAFAPDFKASAHSNSVLVEPCPGCVGEAVGGRRERGCWDGATIVLALRTVTRLCALRATCLISDTSPWLQLLGALCVCVCVCTKPYHPYAQELEENKEYVEAEDEFDIHQPAPSPQQRNGAAASVEAAGDADGDDVEVNIITREPLLLFGEAEDDTAAAAAADAADEQPLLFLPAVSSLSVH